MRAAVYDRYGAPEVVRVAEMPTPRPGSKDVLVRVRAAAVTAADSRIRGARFPRGWAFPARLIFGLRRPRRPVLGSAFSGVVEAVGAKVTGIEVGAEVAGMTGLKFGAHAEYVVVRATRAVPKPAGVTHDQAAGVLFGGSTALHYLRTLGKVAPGQSVLVVGASGAVGTNAVQLAKHDGAVVTAVCSGANEELVRGLGASAVIDYTTTDVTQVAERFDVILDAAGTLSPETGRGLLTPDGVLLMAVADFKDTLSARGNVRAGSAPERPEDFAFLLGMVADGALTVVIDDAVDLDRIVEAHQRVDSGRKVGNLVVHP